MSAPPAPSWRTKRAGIACQNCRQRKVKCDVQRHGIPCRNCMLDEEPCRVKTIRRTRTLQAGVNTVLPAKRTAKADRFLTNQPQKDTASFQLTQAVHTTEWLPPEAVRESSGISVQGWVLQDGALSIVDEEHLHQKLTYSSLIGSYDIKLAEVSQDSPLSVMNSCQAEQPHDPEPADVVVLPSFIKSLSPHIDSADMEYLQKKGAFQLPSSELRNQVIAGYLQYIHPHLPLLDAFYLREIRDTSLLTAGRDPFSILLFQAVMFAAVHLVDPQSILKAGFPTPRDIRSTFYNKVRLLYDFDVEPDRKCIIQSLILMSFMSKTPGDRKGGWHWIGVAVSLAMTLGLHRKVDYRKLDPEESRSRRRLWWSLYIRDRMFGLAYNRPLKIRQGEYDTPMLTLTDFDLGEQVLSTYDQDGKEDLNLAQMCIAMAQLCTHIGEIFSLHFSLLPEENTTPQSNDKTGTTTTLLFVKPQTRIDRVQVYDQELQAWFQRRPRSCIYDPKGPTHPCIVSCAFLNLVFFSTVSALHRPLLRPDALRGFVEYQMLSHRRVCEAALEVSRMSRDLHSDGLARFMPGAACMYQLPAIIMLLRELGPFAERPLQERFTDILSCINVIEDIRELHVGADLAMSFSLDILRGLNIIPQFDSKMRRITGFLCGNDGVVDTSEEGLLRSAANGSSVLQAVQLDKARHPPTNIVYPETSASDVLGHQPPLASFVDSHVQSLGIMSGTESPSNPFDPEAMFQSYSASQCYPSDVLVDWDLLSPLLEGWWVENLQADMPSNWTSC